MATAIQDLDFVAPSDCELAWAGGTLSPPIRAGERVRYFGRGEARGWELGVGAGHHERVLIMNCWDSDIGKQLVALRDTRTVDGSESFPDRVLRVAREAGYEPTGAELEGLLCCIHFGSQSAHVWPSDTDAVVVRRLQANAGPDNQPEAVRARKAGESLMANVPGSYVKILKGDVSRVPSPSGVTWVYLNDPRTGSLADAEQIAQGADTLHGVKLTPFPRPASDYITGVTRDGRDAMISAIIARQVAAGGVDTEGTRHEAERWCAMLAGCVCEGMRATTLMGSLRLVGRELEVVEVFEENNYFSRGTPLSSRDKTPGPHEGATAWASATWEEL